MALFQRRRGRRIGNPGNQPLGLVVPTRGLIITDPKTGEILFDEIAEREKQFRMKGRPPMIFEEDERTEDGTPF
jgi:hypothetical protein